LIRAVPKENQLAAEQRKATPAPGDFPSDVPAKAASSEINEFRPLNKARSSSKLSESNMFTQHMKKLGMVVASVCCAAALLGASKPGAVGAAVRHAVKPPGTGPVGNLRPQGLTFFQQVGHGSFAQPVRLFNGGNATLTNIKITVSGPFSQTNLCKATLAAGGDCIIQLTFTPTQTGVKTGTLTVTDSASDSPQTVTLVGTGVSSPILFNPPGGLAFGSQVLGKTTGAMTVAVTNPAAAALTVSKVVASGDFAETNDCATLVGVSCLIRVTFTPTALGSRTGTLSVTTSAGGPQNYPLSGIGANSGIQLSSAGLTFLAQNVGATSAGKNLRITNIGTSAVSIVAVAASGDYAQTNTCGSNLAAGANCVVTVTFTPSATGLRKGHITISDTDPSNLQTVNLSGQGQVPASTVSVSPLAASVTFTQTQQFTATISGVTSPDVTWAVDGVTGGNRSVGTIDSTGFYTPPAVAGSHNITATSNADKTQSATVPLVVTNYAGTFTYHNDLARTGQNLSETVLTTGNVNSAQFGKLFSYAVDGQTYAQPLYVANVNIPNQGFHNVVYVATEHDSVYAFDADGRTAAPLWQNSYTSGSSVTTVPSSLFTCGSLHPEVGITGTPVIDPVRGALYVVVRTAEVNGGVTTYVQRLHALDITTGAELANSPVVVQPTVPGSGFGNDQNGNVPFDPLKENQRAGLVLLNGSLYIAWGGLCDNNPYHGWLVQYDPNTLQQGAAFNTSPNDWGAPIWDSGTAPAADADGNLYALTGNGDFDLNFGGGEMGDSFLKISTSGGLTLADYFTPYDQSILYHWDLDLGSGGLLVLPDQPTAPTHLLVGGGKEGTIYLINRDDMGQFNSSTYDDSQVVQSLVHAAGKLSAYATTDSGLWSMPAYYQNQIYYVGVGDVPKAFRLFNGQLSPFPASQGTQNFRYPGGEVAISANGAANGIAWTIAEPLTTPQYAVLYAYDAANLANPLYNSASSGTRDRGGFGVQFGQPTVANGKVYVGTAAELDVFGLLP
jgi:hypothetical protein